MGLVTDVKKEDVFERKTTVSNPWLDPAFKKVESLGGEPGFKVDDIAERLGLVQHGEDISLSTYYFSDLEGVPSDYGVKGQFLQTDGESKLSWAWPFWSKAGSTVYYKAGKVAIGHSAPREIFHIAAGQETLASRISCKVSPWRQWECLDSNYGFAWGIAADDKKFHLHYDTPMGTVSVHGLCFDALNSRIGILDDTPSYPCDIGGNTRVQGTLGSGELTVDSGADCSIIIKGTSTGNANLGWIGFYDSDGTTRRGHIGDGSVGNDDIYIGADTGYLRLLAAGYISLGTHTYFPDDVVMSFGASLDYSIGYYSTDDEFQIVDGSTLDSNVRLKLDSSGHFDFGAGNLSTTGILTLANEGLHLLDTNASHDLIVKPGSDLTADRILTLTTGNAARTITLSGNPTLDDWFDQPVKQASDPTFNTVNLQILHSSTDIQCQIDMDQGANQIGIKPGYEVGDNYVIFKSVDDTITSPQIYPNADGEGQLGLVTKRWYSLHLLGFAALYSNAELRFYDNGNYVGFEAPALGADQIWVLPNADGPANEVLGTDNSGNLIWRTHDELAGFVSSEHLLALDEDNMVSDSDTNVATQQSIKAYVDGASFQPLDAELTAIAGLTSAADRYIRFTGSGIADLRTYANVLSDIGAGVGDVTAGANLTDLAVVRGDGGAKGIQGSTAIITDAGEMYNPLQPAFLAYNSVNDVDVTGDATYVAVDFDTEIFDQGGDFAANTFTAPVDGRYPLLATVLLSNLDLGSYETTIIRIITSNRTYYYRGSGLISDVAGNLTLQLSVLADMDADDTAYIEVRVSGGAKTVDIYGGPTMYTYFSGALIC